MNKCGLKLMSAHSFVLFFSNRTTHDAHWADAGRRIALVGNYPAVSSISAALPGDKFCLSNEFPSCQWLFYRPGC